MPGPAPKPPTPGGRRRRDKRGLGIIETITALPGAVPEPPAGLGPAIQEEWNELFSSSLAQTYLPSDLPAISRLFLLRDEAARLLRAYRRNRLVAGSHDQPVISPLASQMNTVLGEVRQLEDRVGLSPMARLKLGIKLGEATSSLASMNQAVNESDDADEVDPRLASAIDAASRAVDDGAPS